VAAVGVGVGVAAVGVTLFKSSASNRLV